MRRKLVLWCHRTECFTKANGGRICCKILLLKRLVQLFGLQPILTILMAFSQISLNFPISKHCCIFRSIAPINQLMPFFSSVKRSFCNHLRVMTNIRQMYLTLPTTASLLVSLLVVCRTDKAVLTSLRNFYSNPSNRRKSICFMMFGWKRAIYKLL